MEANIKLDRDARMEDRVVEFGVMIDTALRNHIVPTNNIPVKIDRPKEPLFVQGNGNMTIFFSELFQTIWSNNHCKDIFITIRDDHEHILVTIKNGVDFRNFLGQGFIEKGSENGCDIEIKPSSNGRSFIQISLKRWKFVSHMWY